MLKGSEKRVQLRQRRTLRLFERLHRRHAPGKFALQGDRGKWNFHGGQFFSCEMGNGCRCDMVAKSASVREKPKLPRQELRYC